MPEERTNCAVANELYAAFLAGDLEAIYALLDPGIEWELAEHTLLLGKRRAIAGLEKSLNGMKKGGYREVLVSPHLAYREEGIPGRIPENALLRIKLWVQDVKETT